MYKDKDKNGIKRNTNMLFMNRFISCKMVKIVEIPKGASFEDEEKNGCVIARKWLVQDYSGEVRLVSYVFATSLLFTLSYRNTYIHTPCSHHAASRLKKISLSHSYSVLASNYKEFYLMTPIVWNKSGIFQNAVNYFRPFINNLLTIIYYKHEQKF